MSDRKLIRVVHLNGNGAIPCHVQNDLEHLQAIVGGYIETIRVIGDLHLVVNEEGAINPFLKVWWVINGQPIYGPAFLTRIGEVEGADDGELDFVGLSDGEAMQLAILLSRTAAEAMSAPWNVTFQKTALGFVDPKAKLT